MLLGKSGTMSPEFSDIADHLPINMSRWLVGAMLDVPPGHQDDYERSADALLHMLRQLHEHKVRLVAGTDIGPHQLAFLRELVLYARASIQNGQASCRERVW